MKRKIGSSQCLVSLILMILLGAELSAQNNTLPNARNEITIDGQREQIWNEAMTFAITVSENWKVTVDVIQDNKYLYFLFSNAKPADDKELYPEILIDANNDKSMEWRSDDWWIHVSYSNCENKGRFNDYSTCKEGPKNGWNANHFPLEPGDLIEVRIEKSLLQVIKDDEIGIAFDVTDTNKNWFFSPNSARLSNPSTWKTIKL